MKKGHIFSVAIIGIFFTNLLLALPEINPYLAQSYNNQTHWNCAATDSTKLSGPKGWYEVTPDSWDIIPNDTFGITIVNDTVADIPIYWFWSGFSLIKFKVDGAKLAEIDRVEIPVELSDYTFVSPKDRIIQANNVESYLKAGDEKGLLEYMKRQPNRLLKSVEDQGGYGAVYTIMTKDDAIIAASHNKIYKFIQLNPKDPMSKMKIDSQVAIPEKWLNAKKMKAFPIPGGEGRDGVLGMNMTYNGYIVLNTMSGNIITLSSDTLELKDKYSVKGKKELFFNSISTGPEANNGAVYTASTEKMYRFVVDAKGKIHADEKSGAWQAVYDVGEITGGVKFASGTGATPTLMGFGPDDDKLVVFTDGASKMRLVAMWRDEIPADWRQKPGTLSKRIADQRQIDFGSEIDQIQSEQSVAVYNNYAFVVNNIIIDEKPYLSDYRYYISMINGATRPGPRGVAMLEWSSITHSWRQKWQRTDISSVSTVPMISGASRMAYIDGYMAPNWDDRYQIGLNIDSGETKLLIRTGTNPIFNGMFATVKVSADGRLLYPMAFGVVLLDTAKMKKLK